MLGLVPRSNHNSLWPIAIRRKSVNVAATLPSVASERIVQPERTGDAWTILTS